MLAALGSAVRTRYAPPYGSVAQLVEHYLDMVVAVGSSPIGATITLPYTKDYHAKHYHTKSHP